MLFKDIKCGDTFKFHAHTFMKIAPVILEREIGGVEDYYEFNCVELREGTYHIICDNTSVDREDGQ